MTRFESLDAEDCFHSARRAEHMAGHALGGGYGHFVRVVAKSALIAIVSYFSLRGVPVPWALI